MTLDNLQDSIDTAGGGGISWDGSTANGVATYKDADEATVESTMTYDGTDLTIARRLAHNGDVDTYIGFDTDNIKLHADGVDFLEVSEGSTDELIVNPGEVDLDFRVKSNTKDDMLFVNAAGDSVGVGCSSPTTTFQVNGTAYISGASTVRGHVQPHADDQWNLGAADKRWTNIYTQDLFIYDAADAGTSPAADDKFLILNSSNAVETLDRDEIIYSISVTDNESATNSVTLTVDVAGASNSTTFSIATEGS